MEFRILGPLEVRQGDRPVPIGAGRQRALLALLLVHRNQPLGADRIVEELWDGAPPATAAKVVQNLVSQLRRIIGAERLRTRGHAYELRLEDEALDAARFDALVEDGARALTRGDARRADRVLAEALALWRGPPLNEFADADWARDEAGRLQERRLVALERRFDAGLALGRHADLVGELRAAVAREPLREGLWAQLMLALYRSGRQAEALAAFGDARRRLVGELGIEPGPALVRLHEAILRQDPTLEPPRAPARERIRQRTAPRLLLAGGGALLVAVALAVAVLLRGGDSGSAALAGTGQLVALDAATGRITHRVAAGPAPATIAAAGGRVWAVDGQARTLVHLTGPSASPETLATGATPIDVAIGAGGVWVVNGTSDPGAAAAGPIADEVVRLDPATDSQRASVALPDRRPDLTSTFDDPIAVTSSAVWALAPDGTIVRIDPASETVTASTPGFRAVAIAAGRAGVWALGLGDVVVRVDERTARITRRVRLPTDAASTLAVGDHGAWVTSDSDGRLWRVDAGPHPVLSAVDVGEGAGDVAAGPRGVWVANPVAGTLTEVDPDTAQVERVVRIGGTPRSLAIDGGTLWAAVTGTAKPVSSRAAGVEVLPRQTCEPVVAGPGGRADALIVSDLPLQGDSRLTAVQMAEAITFVLREHGFRAGRLRLAYQSCDDALARIGGYDNGRCAANGRAYARDRDVLAVIGSYNSGCALSILPALNRAPGGPVPMISPVNTYVGLTHGPPRADASAAIARLYPTGRRNFVHLLPSDDLMGAALARMAADRGRRRVFALHDDSIGYGDLIAHMFVRSAGHLGLDVVGRATWRPSARSFHALTRRVAAARPQAVLVSGLVQSNAGPLVRDLRARLGPGVDILGPDGLAPPSVLGQAAGHAARGVRLAVGGVVSSRLLPPAGRRFVARFGRTQPAGKVGAYPVYAAQATEVLLDAIARSNGTRASVLDRLFATKVRGGLIGDFGFDRNGDPDPGLDTILKVTSGRGSGDLASTEGSVVERVTKVPPDGF